jgi:hypothetical protein
MSRGRIKPHGRRYRAAGEKMIEAKAQLTHGQFGPWLKRNFKIGGYQAQLYMRAARATADMETHARGAAPQAPQSLHAFRRSRGERQTVYPRPWHEGVKESIERAREEMARIREAEKWSHKVALARPPVAIVVKVRCGTKGFSCRRQPALAFGESVELDHDDISDAILRRRPLRADTGEAQGARLATSRLSPLG